VEEVVEVPQREEVDEEEDVKQQDQDRKACAEACDEQKGEEDKGERDAGEG